MRTSTAGNSRQRGFTYALVLASVVAVGVAAGSADLLMSRVVQADREAELIFRGLAVRHAIEAYYRDHQRYPRSLEDLVRDPSSSNRRYLRAAYADPMSGSMKLDSWTTFETSDGGISGVASKSAGVPLKRANFPKEIEKFSEAETYADWKFQFAPVRPGIGVVSTPPSS